MELKRFVSLITHVHRRLQSFLAQCDAVGQAEPIWPRIPGFFAQHRGGETEVELYAIITRSVVRLGRRFAQVLPAGGACEAMLREL